MTTFQQQLNDLQRQLQQLSVSLSNPSGGMQVGGRSLIETFGDNMRFFQTQTVPVASTDPGNVGEIRFDTNFAYFCTTAGWKRVAIAAW